jgi:cysteine desulfurase
VDLDRLYLDYNATSPLSPSVKEWLKSGDELFGNPSSQHTAGKKSKKVINESRDIIYKTFNSDEKEKRLFFHSGATEAFYTVINSFTEYTRQQTKKLLVCFSPLDHSALVNLKEKYWGDHVNFFQLHLKSDLSYDYEKNFSDLLDYQQREGDVVILYHHLWVHNETGLVSPLEELSKLRSLSNLFIHVDAVQAPGKVMEWRSISEGDIWSFSAHKFGALKGIGFSFIKNGTPFVPLFQGGMQQQGLRGGTENPLALKTIALALSDLKKIDIHQNEKLKSLLEDHLDKELQGIGEIVRPNLRNSNTIYFYFNKVASDVALALFDLNGLMISAGSACSSGAAKPSIILTQLGKGTVGKNGLRLSLGFEIHQDLIQKIIEKLKSPIGKIRTLS